MNINKEIIPQGQERLDYRQLMQKRIRRVLLICSSYDAYILEEDGHLESKLIEEYTELNLSNPPTFTRCTTTSEALELLKDDPDFDLIISLYNVGDPDVFEFATISKKCYPDLPIVLLANYSKEIYSRIDREDREAIDYIFFWYGNADLLIAIIKLMEDKMNADADILGAGVQCILLVEDSIRYYSTYLPAIYKLVINQSSEFLKEALNEQQQLLRKRARPKILLATNYTDAVLNYQKYKTNLLGVISDVGFVINKTDTKEKEKLDAGIDLCRLIRNDDPLMPFLLQSSQASMKETADRLGVGFIEKYSKTLLLELAEYISREFAFGDFIFRDNETGEIIGRARDLRDMQKLVMEIPDEELLYHTSQNHLSKWLYSRGLFTLAATLKPRTNQSFETVDQIRRYIRDAIKDYRIYNGQGVVARFDPATYNDAIGFARIGEGSLGGKARGLAFFNSLLQRYDFYDRFEGVRVLLPRTLAVTTDMFDRFIVENGLQYVINSDISDGEILSEFVSSRLPEQLVDDLRVFLKYVRGPLAIRSSSKLEDSYYQPFAGVYSTYMIPMTKDRDQMLRLLGKAIKSVYASVFYSASRAYIAATSNVLSDEKMGIVIQEVCGTADGGYFFPTMSGTARSVNFYPIGNEKPEDGVVNVAMGLGKYVVDGGKSLRFSPKYPKKILQLSTPELALKDTQNKMYALVLKPEEFKTSIDDAVNLQLLEINSEPARSFRNMKYAASTWDRENERICDSDTGPGRKIISFATILKYGGFPIPGIIRELLDIASREMRCPVEIEFAFNADVAPGKKAVFNFLQVRPIAETAENTRLDWDGVDTTNAVVYARKALGTGAIEGVTDFIYIKNEGFDPRHNQEIATQLAGLNKTMDGNRGYVLAGFGRWGSSDPWLGVPVKWIDISNAKTIIECGLTDYRIEPSEGTHFFQNLTSFGVGYMTVNPFMGDGRIDWQKLESAETVSETQFLRHVRFAQPLYIFVDGLAGKGIIALEAPTENPENEL